MSQRRILGPSIHHVVIGIVLMTAGAFALWLGPADAQTSRADLLETLRTPGHVVLKRHSLAPGSRDPSNFDIARCETQRNLGAEGRAQAVRFGATLRDAGIEVAGVYSGRWCRNLDTATLMDLGDVVEAPAFDSQMNLGSGKEAEGNAFLDALPRDAATMVIVSHASNIRGLTGRSVTSGEALVLRLLPEGGFDVLGSLGVL